jgi:ATP-dependent Clp protease protease subunit
MFMVKFSSVPQNITPMIFEKTRDGEVLYDVYSRLVKERIIFLSEDVDAVTGTTIAATLLWLDHQNNKDISLYINTSGGTISDGLFTIYDTMQYIKSDVQTVCIGEAYSAGAVLLAAGTQGKRMAFANAEIMIHEVQSGLEGSSSEIEKQSKRIKRLGDTLYEIMARHTGQSLDKIKDDCQEEMYLTAKEALDYGIIDKIVLPTKKPLPLKKGKKTISKRRKA